jgi:hypothetical protein
VVHLNSLEVPTPEGGAATEKENPQAGSSHANGDTVLDENQGSGHETAEATNDGPGNAGLDEVFSYSLPTIMVLIASPRSNWKTRNCLRAFLVKRLACGRLPCTRLS